MYRGRISSQARIRLRRMFRCSVMLLDCRAVAASGFFFTCRRMRHLVIKLAITICRNYNWDTYCSSTNSIPRNMKPEGSVSCMGSSPSARWRSSSSANSWRMSASDITVRSSKHEVSTRIGQQQTHRLPQLCTDSCLSLDSLLPPKRHTLIPISPQVLGPVNL